MLCTESVLLVGMDLNHLMKVSELLTVLSNLSKEI
jgi:hypothetical protein